MEIIGIICEYNPFHNGHLYHIKQIKKKFPNSIIILVMSGNFLERGEVSIINKWDKTKIALNYDVNIVVELPFHFATQAADIFAFGAIKILDALHVNKLIFGSECNDIRLLTKLANAQIENDEFENKVKEYMDKGINYPTAMSKALNDIVGSTVNSPNDILGLSYIKEIKKQKSNIKPITIKRTSNYKSIELNKKIVSALSIREAIKNKISIENFVPKYSLKFIDTDINMDKYFPLLKYKIISEIDCLDQYQSVDEGIENRIKKQIYLCNNMEDFIKSIKTKRYTYNKIQRMLMHILCGFTKDEATKLKESVYVRILGFDEMGKKYLNEIKKEIPIPVVSNYSTSNGLLNLEFRVNAIYASIFDYQKQCELIELETKSKPIIK
ncbi:MAG: nucleotidyltransferase [Bacilli bacterium]|nr:nucleotidyltransferase [Bacilli bacterium]